MKRIMGGLTLGLLLGVLASTAAAQQVGQRTIRVGAVGEVVAMPDEARISFAVESFGATAQAASQQNAQTMERVIQALTRAGIPRGDIQTQHFNIFPEYDHDMRPPRPTGGPEQPRIRGYRAMNQVLLRTRELERVGQLIDVALQAGANRMDGVGFTLRDSQAAQQEALRRAVAQARGSAETIAAALGVRLGDVLDASTSMDLIQPRPMMMEQAMVRSDMAVAAMAPPIQPGEQTVRAQVSMVFSIGG